jgi:hypothetical protein
MHGRSLGRLTARTRTKISAEMADEETSLAGIAALALVAGTNLAAAQMTNGAPQTGHASAAQPATEPRGKHLQLTPPERTEDRSLRSAVL